MAFGDIGERLALIIDGNAAGGISALKKVGDTAETQFAKAKTSQEKWSHGLLVGGAAAVGVAAVIGKGLLETVHAYGEGEQASLKLENTMKNQPQLAHASESGFKSLAQSISETTEASRDGAIAAEAMLGQFGLNQKQITTLLPLVVDLSQKMGIDLPTAAKLVGKTVETGTNALLRQGVVIDKTALKTDAYGATVDALRSKVGGFATEQGKTFEGQLKILQNQLHNLAEGVGKGATEQLSSMLGATTGLATGMGHLSDKTQGSIGKIGVIGVTAIGGAGGVAVLGGAVLNLITKMTVADGETGVFGTSLNGLGAAAAGVGIASLVLGIYEYGKAANQTKIDVDALAGATTNKLVDGWAQITTQLDHVFGKTAAARIELTYYKQIAEQNIGTAIRLKTALDAQGVDTTALGKVINDTTKAQAQANSDTQAGATAVAGLSDATDTATTSDSNLAAASKEAHDQLQAQRVETERLADKTLDVADAQRSLAGDIRGITTAELDVHDKQVAWTQAVKAHGAESEEAIRALIDYQNAQDGVGQSSDDAKRAIQDLAAKQSGNSSAAEAAASNTGAYIGHLKVLAGTLAPGSALRKWLDQYIARLQNIPTAVNTTITQRFQDLGKGNQGSVIDNGGRRRFAAGGDPTVGEEVDVGELGKETAVFEAPVHIYPAGAPPVRTARPSSKHAAASVQEFHFHLHVEPTMGSNATSFARSLGDLISRDMKSGGPIALALRKAMAN